MVPVELQYTKDHEWIRVDQSTGTIGITDHAQNELGDIVFVELPKAGDHVSAKESLGSVESVKAVSDIYSPVSGEVLAVNAKLQDKPELINTDPYGDGWLVRVSLSDPHEVETLMSSEEYAAYVQDKAAH
ncbi:MAG: glycine cleavage system protein GcvH [Acidobacteria bacterium]|nr:MAG: glycine cleavage system protein GcvH [Acidobacteriota bacterium]